MNLTGIQIHKEIITVETQAWRDTLMNNSFRLMEFTFHEVRAPFLIVDAIGQDMFFSLMEILTSSMEQLSDIKTIQADNS